MIGKTLGHYEILGPLGAGGMGEVYRARDTHLERDVAIKVLPEDFAADQDRLARFEREAKLLAQLNHPHIASIFGLEESDGTRFIAMECVEGVTLAEKIEAEGRIEVDEALEIARQIAEALEAAHEAGIIHRDLKPANVKVTPEGKVKVLDFGLAKAYEADGSASEISPDLSHSPTMAAATQTGVIMGTAAYMSPEQAKGKPLDKRTDIWSFGALLYEMLKGRSAFQGEDVSDTLAAVLRAEVKLDALPAEIPARLRQVLAACLQRDVRHRARDMGDVVLALDGAFETVVPPLPAEGARIESVWRHPFLVAAGTAVLTAALLWAVWGRVWSSASSETAIASVRASLADAELRVPLNSSLRIAISRDGSQIAVASFVNGESKLLVRGSNQAGFREIEGTEGANSPTFSPDGAWLAYMQRPQGTSLYPSQVRRVRVSDGLILDVTEGACPHWGLDDVLVFGRADGIYRVDPNGGDPTRIVEIGTSGSECWGPRLLPDGQAIFFQREGATGPGIWLAEVESGVFTDLGISGGNPQYVSSGHLVFGNVAGQKLMAVAFDLEEHRVVGEPLTVLPDVLVFEGGATQFAVSDAGTAVFGLPHPFGINARELTGVDASGASLPLPLARGQYQFPRFSPDGRRIAYARENRVWTHDLESGSTVLLTKDYWGNFLAWSADGSHVYFASRGEDSLGYDVMREPADRSASAEPLPPREGDQYPLSAHVDGGQLLVGERGLSREWDLLVATERPDGWTYREFLTAPWNEVMGAFSPDGGSVAYVSDESGAAEVYVRSFPDGQRKQRVSLGGGTSPRWAPDGTAIYYLSDRRVMRVPFTDRDVGDPRPLVEGSWVIAAFGGLPAMTNWDVHPDGSSFLFVTNPLAEEDVDRPLVPLEVVVNWFEELNRLVPTGR